MGECINPYDGMNRARDKVKGLVEIINALVESPNPCEMSIHTLYYTACGVEDDLDASHEMLGDMTTAKVVKPDRDGAAANMREVA